jgi:type IV pilus assembly protein PilW
LTLIELMVGMVIGLVALLVIGQTMAVFEGEKRNASGGSDAQTNGYLSLLALERDIRMAGSGLIGADSTFSCKDGTYRQYNGATETTPPPSAPGAPSFLPPVRIIDGGSGVGGDAIVVMRSEVSYAGTVGSLLETPWTTVPRCALAGGMQAPTTDDPNRGDGELFLIAPNRIVDSTTTRPCNLVQASAKTEAGACAATDPNYLQLLTATGSSYPYNAAALPTPPSANDLIIPMGRRPYIRYGVDQGRLMKAEQLKYISAGNVFDADTDPMSEDVVFIKAQYGIDTTCTTALGTCSSVVGSQSVDRFVSASTPGWTEADITRDNAARIKAIRVVVVVRNSQYNRDPVSPASITLWDVVNAADSAAPVLNVSALPDGQNYRYRVFETIVPLNNMIWGQL